MTVEHTLRFASIARRLHGVYGDQSLCGTEGRQRATRRARRHLRLLSVGARPVDAVPRVHEDDAAAPAGSTRALHRHLSDPLQVLIAYNPEIEY